MTTYECINRFVNISIKHISINNNIFACWIIFTKTVNVLNKALCKKYISIQAYDYFFNRLCYADYERFRRYGAYRV